MGLNHLVDLYLNMTLQLAYGRRDGQGPNSARIAVLYYSD